MKEVKKCSISGVAFTLDTDAYEELSAYLDTLKKNYQESSDGAEIVADIEARIAELILSAQAGDRVVELPLVRNIIRQMGTAADISDGEGAVPHAEQPRIPRRLYRDVEHAKLGGVCAGIGKYFDVDPVWVRLCFFVPLILTVTGALPFMHWMSGLMGNLFGIFVLCYVVMWFAVPAARSARQKLEMTGERITSQSIRETTEAATAGYDPDAHARPIVATAVSTFGKLVLILLKIFAGLIVFGLIIAASALIIGLFAVIVGAGALAGIFATYSLWVPILLILVCLIPLMLLIYVLMCLIASRKPGGWTVLILFVMWLAVGVATVSVVIHENVDTDGFHWKQHRLERVLNNSQVVIDGDTTTMERLFRKDYPHSSHNDNADDDMDTGVNIHTNTEDGGANIRITSDSISFKTGKVSGSVSVDNLKNPDSLFD